MEWQIGEPPSAPPGPPVFPSGPVANLSVASPTSALRRLGAEAATFSPKERERVARQARLERAALESFSGELLLSEVGTYLAPAERKPPAGCCVPKDVDIDKLVTHVHTHTELYHRRTAREPTIFDEFMRTALEEACATYRGVYYTPEKMMQLPEGERIHLLLQSSDDHPDWWMLPDTDAAGYNHQDSTVEKMYGFDATLTEIKGSYVKARQHGQALVQMLVSAKVFRRPVEELGERRDVGGIYGERVRNFVVGLADAKHRTRIALNYQAGGTDRGAMQTVIAMADFTRMDTAWVQAARSHLVNRLKFMAIAKAKTNEMLAKVREITVERRAECTAVQKKLVDQGYGDASASHIINILVTVDQWMPIIDELSASTASRLMVVLRGIAAWRTKAYAPIITHLSTRFPRLHIFVVPGTLPHNVTSGGTGGQIYANRQLGVGVSIVSSRLRKNVREEEETTTKLVTEALDRGEELDRTKNPRVDRKLAAHQVRLLRKDDLGYAINECKAMLRDADLVPLHAEQRRVKNDGWKPTTFQMSDVHQLHSVDIGSVWNATGKAKLGSPEVTIELVHEATGERVVPDDPCGGMEPERWLMNTMRDTHAISIPQRDSVPRNIEEVGGSQLTYGAMALFWPKCLTSFHEGARFKIRARSQFRMTNGGPVVTLESYSAPFNFFASKRSKSATVGRKRKELEKS